MYRYLLASTAVAALAAPAGAREISTAVTQPVRTSDADDGAPGPITVVTGGSVTVTGGAAVTMDSDHAVTNRGKIAVTAGDGTTGILATQGRSGAIVNEGEITVGSDYTPVDTDKDGDLDGPFALGSGRAGIRVDGAHNGDVTVGGTVTVRGNQSFGVTLGGPLTGTLLHTGTTGVTGDDSVAVAAQAVGGDVRLGGNVGARGANAVGARLGGDIGGALVVDGTVAATGYRQETAPSDTSKLDADDLLQGGSALIVAGNVAGGILLTREAAQDGDTADTPRATGRVRSFGAAPAMAIGAEGRDIAIGPVAGSGSAFGVVVDGEIAGRGVYAGVDANGLTVGGRGGAVSIANGMAVSGSITAVSTDAAARAITLGAGAQVPRLQISGAVGATTGNRAEAGATAIAIGEGAGLTAIGNSGAILAEAGKAGTAAAIVDRGGSLNLIENSGSIAATGAEDAARNVAIDLSANTSGAIVRQTVVAEGVDAPAITGAIRFGSGADRLDVQDGGVTGAIAFGAGDNALAVSGDAAVNGAVTFGAGADNVALSGTGALRGAVDFGGGADRLTLADEAVFDGSVGNAAGLAVETRGGVLSLRGTSRIGSLTMGTGSTLLVTLGDPDGDDTAITVDGAASFAQDTTLGVRLAQVDGAEGRHTILRAGSVSGLGGLNADDALLPFLFKATVASDAPANELAIDVTLRSSEELGLNASQASAFDAAFAALGRDEEAERVFLEIAEGDLFRYTLGQMLPDHAGGTFEGISRGTRTLGARLIDPTGPVYDIGGLDVNAGIAFWSSDKPRGGSAAFDQDGHGFTVSAGKDIGFGTLGLGASYLYNEHTRGDDNTFIASETYALSAFWRGEWGGLNAFGRAAIGTANMDSRRSFVGAAATKDIRRDIRADWGGTTVSFAGGASYEAGWGYLVLRPEVSIDYVSLDENGYSETGGGALDLIVDGRKSDELAANGGMSVGVDFHGAGRGDANWLRVELEGGWRELIGGSLGSTTARFGEDGQRFTLNPDARDSGWTAALRAIGGSRQFTLLGEIGAERRYGTESIAVRGSIRSRF